MNGRSSNSGLIKETGRGNETAILTAALEAFAAQGFNGSSMRDIARRSRTSLSNLYNYYPSKSHLLAEVLRQANAELLARTERTVAKADNVPVARLRAAVKAYVGFVVDHQTAALVAISEFRYLAGEDREQVVQARDHTQSIFEKIVRQGVDSGEFATPYPEDAARNIVSMCSAISTWDHKRGRLSGRALGEQHARYALALLETRELG